MKRILQKERSKAFGILHESNFQSSLRSSVYERVEYYFLALGYHTYRFRQIFKRTEASAHHKGDKGLARMLSCFITTLLSSHLWVCQIWWDYICCIELAFSRNVSRSCTTIFAVKITVILISICELHLHPLMCHVSESNRPLTPRHDGFAVPYDVTIRCVSLKFCSTWSFEPILTFHDL